jgi:RNA polymerase sigma factor (sigma-70 family)
MNETVTGEGLSKSGLLEEFWKFRRLFLFRIRRLTPNPDTAEDIFQEACLKFPSVFLHPQAGTKYFGKILRTVALQQLKKRRRLEYRENLPEIVCESQRDWERNDMLHLVEHAIADLPKREQRLLSVFFKPGLTLEDRCRVLRVPNSTMRYRANRTIANLRKIVAREAKYLPRN